MAERHPTHTLLFTVLIAICILFVGAIFLVTNDDDGITAWASLSKQIRPFADACEAEGGTVVVQKVKGSDDREFTCTYPDGTQEVYTFSKR